MENDLSNSSQGTSFTDRTSLSLLLAVRTAPGDSDAWQQFVDRYQPRIRYWCRSWGLQESDREDVSQDVLLRLAKALKRFDYDPNRSFRAWLKTVTHHAWVDWANRQKKVHVGRADSGVFEKMYSLEAREDLAQRLEEEFDAELAELASLRVRMRVKPRTWSAFHLTSVEGLSGAEVAQKLGMQVAHVYVAKHEVMNAIREEIRKLEPTDVI